MTLPPKHHIRFAAFASALALAALLGLARGDQAARAQAGYSEESLELSRPARPWEFLSATGTRAGLFGNEAGTIEAWVYPLKILRNFRLRFHLDGATVPAEALVRRVIVRPESSTIVYAGDTFSVRETFFVPVHEPGAIIFLDVNSEDPLNIDAAFQRDFQLEWPAALGGTYHGWNSTLHAFGFGEDQHKFAALVGSPTASDHHEEYETNYSASNENSFSLGATAEKRETKIIVIAASVEGAAEVEAAYKRLAANANALLENSAEYYRKRLAETIRVELPDAQVQQAYDWTRISLAQGMVTNPFLGTGLVAGYRTSGSGQRPGFAWYFGRDALWSSLALDSEGDFATARTALEFLSKYQRDDGKIPHEISQGATFVPWFKSYDYAYASADATPLFIIAMNDYVTQSGDVAFAKEKWDNIWKAYEFLRSTLDSQGLAQNQGVGHGWVEGGPLLPVKAEIYQSGLGVEAARAVANLGRAAGKLEESRDAGAAVDEQKKRLNDAFWSPEQSTYAYALDREGKRVALPSVLATVPMWFDLLNAGNADKMLAQLADEDHETDWGMRIISSRWPQYSGGGYHFGSVWPLFTGWAAVAEYRYHRAFSGFANLRANALLALDGSLGHVTEVLSGDNYEPLSGGSPHQIWSAAMVISPLLRGLLGLQVDATTHSIVLAPHVPADWNSFAIKNVGVGGAKLDFNYRRTADEITLEVKKTGTGDCVVNFQPAVSLRAEVAGAELNGRRVAYRVQASDVDQHVETTFSAVGGTSTLRIRLRGDFGISYTPKLPPLGSPSRGLRILSETWTPARDSLALEVAGAAGATYELGMQNAEQIASVDGAEIKKSENGLTRLEVAIPMNGDEAYPHANVTIHFVGVAKRSQRP